MSERIPYEGQDRCDKCGLEKSRWNEEPICKGASVTQSPRHKITRFFYSIPAGSGGPGETPNE